MLRGAILFFLLLFIAFVIYKAFPTINGHKNGVLASAIGAPSSLKTINETTKEEEIAQEQVELNTSTIAGGGTSPEAQEQQDESGTLATPSDPLKEGFTGNTAAFATGTDSCAAIVGCPDFATPPGKLPAALAGNISDNAPRPSFDPALQPATTARILQGLDDLNGFINFEAPALEERSDPQIQLPLSTLKADLQILTNEALVLERNPGLRSTITELQMNQIEANLAYLQKMHRKFEASTA
jgi:hypothetical protein